jgi:hypothetical protein
VIGVVHLVWGPLGPEPLRDFVASYRAHPAGAEHELVVVSNGVTDRSLLRELDGVEHRLIELDEPVLDLAAYDRAARALTHERLCFLNSYSVILGDDWLAHLARALDEPDAAIVGATASWESQAEWRRGAPRYWLYQLTGLREARRDYPRFPNPHIRTTGFMIPRELLLELGLGGAVDKRAAYMLESGWNGITRELRRRGRRALVVGRDGRSFDVDDWPASGTFRLGDQDNLLISDNQTRAYQGAWERLRRRLRRAAWGKA